MSARALPAPLPRGQLTPDTTCTQAAGTHAMCGRPAACAAASRPGGACCTTSWLSWQGVLVPMRSSRWCIGFWGDHLAMTACTDVHSEDKPWHRHAASACRARDGYWGGYSGGAYAGARNPAEGMYPACILQLAAETSTFGTRLLCRREQSLAD